MTSTQSLARGPKVVPVINMAGSSGKTTTATTVSYLLAEQGQRVLMVDLDPQANATEWFGIDPYEVEISAAAVMLHRGQPGYSVAEAMLKTDVPGLFVLPATDREDRMAAEVKGLENERRGEMRLRLVLADFANAVEAGKHDGFDVVIVDCPGSVGVMSMAALIVATGVITVAMPGTKELKGIPKLERLVVELVEEGLNTSLRLDAVVPCIVPPRNAGRYFADGLAFLQESLGERVAPPVRRSVVVGEAHSAALPLPLYAPDEPVTQDYRAVVTWLQGRGVV